MRNKRNSLQTPAAIIAILVAAASPALRANSVFNVDAYNTAPGTPSDGDLVFDFQSIGPQTYTAYITSFAADGSIQNVVQGNVKGTMPNFSVVAGSSSDPTDFAHYISDFQSTLSHFPFSTATPLSFTPSTDTYSGGAKTFPSWTWTDYTIFPTAWNNINNVVNTYGLGTLPAVDINGLYTWSPTVFLVYGTVNLGTAPGGNLGGIGTGGGTDPDPEPATLILLGAGLLSLGVLGRRRLSARREIAD